MNVTDPVCGMQVDTEMAAASVEYSGHTYYFCSRHCQEKFNRNPRQYRQPEDHHQANTNAATQYTCPLPVGRDEELKHTLYQMMGIKNVYYDGVRWEISYDLLQATAKQIERTISEFGAQLGGNWAEQLRRAFVHYVEETELLNLENPGGSHSHHH